MMGNTFGKVFRVTTCGESYSGCFRKTDDIPPQLYGGLLTIVDGVPAGIRITAEDIQAELDKRKPGQSKLDSPRKEKDRAYIFSGVMEDQRTTGGPVGMTRIPGCLIPDASYLHEGMVVSDVIYEPRETELLRMAREAGLKTFNGMYMLLYQGAASFKLWTGHDMPTEQVKAKYFQ